MAEILITGVPGAGKTQYAIDYALQKAEQFEKENGKPREVYYYNIKDLKIDSWKKLEDPYEWYKTPTGSLIIIDEAQDFFGRTQIKKAPSEEFLVRIADHRHRGHDLILVTQSPTLMAPQAVELVGEHYHVYRPFGSRVVTIYRWEYLQKSPNSKSAQSIATKKKYKYKKSIMDLYKSTEVDTHKFRIPRLAIYFGLIIIIAIAVIYVSYDRVTTYVHGEENDTQQTEQESKRDTVVLNTQINDDSYLRRYEPRIRKRPDTAPRYDKLTQPKTVPEISCADWGPFCECYLPGGQQIHMPQHRCKSIARHGIFYDWRDYDNNREQRKILESENDRGDSRKAERNESN